MTAQEASRPHEPSEFGEAAQQATPAWFRSLLRYQSRFSLVSALFAATVMVVLLVDVLVRRDEINARLASIGIMLFSLFSIVPLVLGRRYPRWAGLVFAGSLAGWACISLIQVHHPHAELNAMLEAPIIAVYLGWFYRPWRARVMLLAYLAVLAVSLMNMPQLDAHEFSSPLSFVYATLISWFCLETGMYLRRRATRDAHTDSLTGALNRRGLNEHGRSLIHRTKRLQQPMTIAAIDFDDFKSLNDTAGHAAGDAALSGSVALWRSALGPQDLVARVGGDEFILVIHADLDAAERILQEISAAAPYRWSWGVSAIESDTTLSQALERADGELYRAKARRRAQPDEC